MDSYPPQPYPLNPYAQQLNASQPNALQPLDPRVGDLERSAACDQLSSAFATGRLDSLELDDRLARAMSARTRSELQPLLTDLASAAQPRPQPELRPSWTGYEMMALVMLIGSVVLVCGMLLVMAGAGVGYFLGSLVGGTLAFVAGVSSTVLIQRFVRRTRESALRDRH
jgi:hypothetical protein